MPAQNAAFSKKELATSLGHTATETLVLLVARNKRCVLPPSHSPQQAYPSIVIPNDLGFLRNHIPNTGLSAQVWCFPTPTSAVIYLTTSKVTQKQEWGKGIPLVPGHFRRQPSPTSSPSWLKHYNHTMQITEPPQRTVPQAGTVQVLPEKAILL